jgi:hypothetical protein
MDIELKAMLVGLVMIIVLIVSAKVITDNRKMECFEQYKSLEIKRVNGDLYCKTGIATWEKAQ